jgi:hypothetical protein
MTANRGKRSKVRAAVGLAFRAFLISIVGLFLIDIIPDWERFIIYPDESMQSEDAALSSLRKEAGRSRSGSPCPGVNGGR